ncbi:MAG: phosphatase PAP2 family protein [Acidobacteria bacterium]|nr:phosphatase PAP2 family protein [Acidobacteriota bacterium]
MLAVTDLGGRGFVWVAIALIAFVIPERRADAWRSLLTILVTFLLVDGMLKPLIWRDRPFDVFPDDVLIAARATTSSFPSGHAASAFAGALATSRLLPGARALWFVLAVLIAYSRLYLGVHFPLDVLAGAVIGTLCALFVLGGRRAVRTETGFRFR